MVNLTSNKSENEARKANQWYQKQVKYKEIKKYPILS